MQKVKQLVNKKITVVCLLLIPVLLSAQSKPSKDFSISAQSQYGFILIPSSRMEHLVKGHIYGAELNYIYRTDGSKTWQQIHNYPEIGICALHLYLGNPQQLGNLEGLYPYVNFRLNKLKSRVSLKFRVGVGLAYLTKTFNRLENPKNDVIGSHVNGLVNLRLNMGIQLSDYWLLETGIGLTHASNGAYQTPNLGLNNVTVNVGVGYVIGNKNCVYQKDTIPQFTKQWKPSIIAVCGIKELDKPLGKKYMAYGIQANLYRHINYKNSVGGGVEISYTDATKQEWVMDSVYKPTASQLIQIGAKVGYLFNIGKLSLPIDFGYYIYKKEKYNGDFFHRIGIRYMVTKHIIANATLLTHWFTADYFEWGVGYQF